METPGPAALSAVRDAYGRRAQEYASLLGSVESLAEADIALVREWALAIEGPVHDVGCGPGQWTHLLRGLGADARGIDPVAEFVELARATYPGESFSVGRAEAIGADEGTIGGVLAWYSLIHTAPENLPDALRELHRILAPGGGLAVGFFEGPDLLPFEHAVTTAFFWPMDRLVGRLHGHPHRDAHRSRLTAARSDPRAPRLTRGCRRPRSRGADRRPSSACSGIAWSHAL